MQSTTVRHHKRYPTSMIFCSIVSLCCGSSSCWCCTITGWVGWIKLGHLPHFSCPSIVLQKGLSPPVELWTLGIESPYPHSSLLHQYMGHSSQFPHLDQQSLYVVPHNLCSWYWCSTLMSGKCCLNITDAWNSLAFMQMLWTVSFIALYILWAEGTGSQISISLWLWLGVLSTIQGVSLCIILLQTLSCLHSSTVPTFSQRLCCLWLGQPSLNNLCSTTSPWVLSTPYDCDSMREPVCRWRSGQVLHRTQNWTLFYLLAVGGSVI